MGAERAMFYFMEDLFGPAQCETAAKVCDFAGITVSDMEGFEFSGNTRQYGAFTARNRGFVTQANFELFEFAKARKSTLSPSWQEDARAHLTGLL